MNTFRNIFIVLIATLISQSVVLAQDSYEISGYVVDKETGDPVPYASVGVPELHRGISANMNGHFRLLLPEVNINHHLQISSIGYERLTIPLSEFRGREEVRIELTAETTLLEEIVIVGKSQTVEQLVKSVSKNRKEYLRSKPYLMDGFYREVLKTDGTYKGITEAQGILYLNGYNPGYKNNRHPMTYDLVQWKHIRRSNYPDTQQQYLEIANLLRTKDFFLHDGPLNKRNLDKYAFSITDSTIYQERLVLEISFEPKDDNAQFEYEGRMYVKEDDQALLGLDIISGGREPYLLKTEGQQDISSSFKISFSKFEGQYYLGYLSMNRSYRVEDKEINWSTELIGVSFSNQQAMFLTYNQRVVLYSEMLNPMINYDHDFWESYSFAGTTDVSKIDHDEEMEKQFEANHQQRLLPLPQGFDSYEQMANDRNALDFLMQR